MDWHMFQYDPFYMLNIAVRLLVSCILGGIIGFEREYSHHRPAGFRTHILVSLGACLAMIVSQFASDSLKGDLTIDPTRIGAQVVSGIGFLGAGAIIRHGLSVKGLTTAASLWTVACVGLACGIGFYAGAVLATILIWAILMYLKNVKERFKGEEKPIVLEIEAENSTEMTDSINMKLKKFDMIINNVEMSVFDNGNSLRISYVIGASSNAPRPESFVSDMMALKGIKKVTYSGD